jgi:hypothetical protein
MPALYEAEYQAEALSVRTARINKVRSDGLLVVADCRVVVASLGERSAITRTGFLSPDARDERRRCPS